MCDKQAGNSDLELELAHRMLLREDCSLFVQDHTQERAVNF
jgi:hypothetical protein